MQDRYAGDVGDFGKLGMLRGVFSRDSCRLGIVWYRYPNEMHNKDGGNKAIEYLGREDFRECDPELIDKLSQIVRGERSVRALEESGLLPKETVFFSDMCEFYSQHPGQSKIQKDLRVSAREQWLSKAVDRTKSCNVLFLDPDNGLEIASCASPIKKKAGKFVFFSEVSLFGKDRDVLVIYQHFDRGGSHVSQMERRMHALRRFVNPSGRIYGLRFSPYSPRAYFILTNQTVSSLILARLETFLESSWRQHWDTLFHEPNS